MNNTIYRLISPHEIKAEQAVINETERVEKSSTLNNMGPDIDKNYGWDGVIYLCDR